MGIYVTNPDMMQPSVSVMKFEAFSVVSVDVLLMER